MWRTKGQLLVLGSAQNKRKIALIHFIIWLGLFSGYGATLIVMVAVRSVKKRIALRGAVRQQYAFVRTR